MGQVLDFNPMQYNPSTAMEKLPAGWYKAQVEKASIEETQAKDGIYLKCQFKIIEGPFAGRFVYTNLNLKNPNQKTVDIANAQLTAMCGCMGKWTKISNTDELLNIPLQIKVTDKGDSEYNEVKGFKDINGNDPVKPGTGSTPMAASTGLPPVAQLAAPPAVSAATQPWPPPGWTQHPNSPIHYYSGQDVKTEAELRAMFSTPSAPPSPPAVPAVPAFNPGGNYPPPAQPAMQPGAPPQWTPGGTPPPAWTPQK